MPTVHRIAAAEIERAERVGIADIAVERGFVLKKVGGELIGPCPRCRAGVDRFAIRISANLFNCRACGSGGRGAISFLQWIDRCTFREAVEILVPGPGRVRPAERGFPGSARTPDDHDRRQREKARYLWTRRLPITGTVAEIYLRQARGIGCALPMTMAFLPPTKPGHCPALIACFALACEVEPGVLTAPRDVQAVHLTLLRADGSGKIEVQKPDSNKLIIASPNSTPIVIAPPNDLLGLAICEGIEDGLSIHEALGLGVWVAGSAPHLGKLDGVKPDFSDSVVPDYIDSVSIFTDADADHQGERNASLLAQRLRARGIEAIIEGIDP